MSNNYGVPPSEIPLVQRAWYGRQAPDASAVGDQLKADFVARMNMLCGDMRFLLLYAQSDTTSTTDRSRNALVFTHDATIAGEVSRLGSGTFRTFNGTADESDTPDIDNLSFGDAAADQPFSIIALVNPDVANAVSTIYAKWDETTATPLREFWFIMDVNGYPQVECYDESADTYIGREDQTALTTATWTLLVVTYDGSAANTGIRIYKDGARVDDANSSSGTYVAMENTATLPTSGFHKGASATEEFWDGGIGLTAVAAKALSQDEVWAIKSAVNGYFDLSL